MNLFLVQLDTSVNVVSLPVTHPACTVLIMDYAGINLRGVSEYSPPVTWTGKSTCCFLYRISHYIIAVYYIQKGLVTF